MAESNDPADDKPSALERWGRAATSKPVAEAFVLEVVKFGVGKVIPIEGPNTLDPLIENAAEHVSVRRSYVEGQVHRIHVMVTGAEDRVEELLVENGPEFRRGVRRQYGRATSPTEVNAVEQGARDGYILKLRHLDHREGAEQDLYLDAWRWARRFSVNLRPESDVVQTELGLRLADVSSEMAKDRIKGLDTHRSLTATPISSGTHRTSGPSEIDLLKNGLRSIAADTNGVVEGLEGMIDEMAHRIGAVDALFNEACKDGQNLTDLLQHASRATVAAADALLLAAIASDNEADRL